MTAADSLEEIWIAHSQDPANLSYFSQSVSLTFVPTTCAVNGSHSLQQFMQLHGSSLSALTKTSQLISRTFAGVQGGVHVCEQWAVELVHDSLMPWLLPGVHSTQKLLQFPLVIIGTLSNEKVDSVKYYWDQATVLRQIGLLPSDVQRLPMSARQPVHAKIMPIAMGHDQLQRLMDIGSDQSGNKLDIDGCPWVSLDNIEEQMRNVSVSTKHSISEQPGDKQVDSVRLSRRQSSKTSMFGPDSDVIEQQQSPMKQRNSAQSQMSLNAAKNDSHFSFGDDDALPLRMPTITSQKTSRAMSTSSQQSNVDHDSDVAQGKANALKNDSHFSFAHDQTVSKDPQFHSHKRPGSANQSQDHWMGGMVSEASEFHSQKRPGSANQSQDHWMGGMVSEAIEFNSHKRPGTAYQTQDHWKGGMVSEASEFHSQKRSGSANQTQDHWKGGMVSQASEFHSQKRPGTANQTQDHWKGGMVSEANEFHSHKRLGAVQSNQDHWSANDGSTSDLPSILDHRSAKKYHNQSHFAFGDEGAEGVKNGVNVWESSSNGLGSVQSRPSSRVLNVPGGASTFSFA